MRRCALVLLHGHALPGKTAWATLLRASTVSLSSRGPSSSSSSASSSSFSSSSPFPAAGLLFLPRAFCLLLSLLRPPDDQSPKPSLFPSPPFHTHPHTPTPTIIDPSTTSSALVVFVVFPSRISPTFFLHSCAVDGRLFNRFNLMCAFDILFIYILPDFHCH